MLKKILLSCSLSLCALFIGSEEINIDLSFHINNELINQLVDKGRIFFCEQHNNEVRESKLSVIQKSKDGFFKQSLFDINIPFESTPYNANEFNFI